MWKAIGGIVALIALIVGYVLRKRSQADIARSIQRDREEKARETIDAIKDGQSRVVDSDIDDLLADLDAFIKLRRKAKSNDGGPGPDSS